MALEFAAWLGDRLRQRGESQRAFAGRVGVAPNTVKDWLRGAQPTWDNCHAIAEALETDLLEVTELAGYPLPATAATTRAAFLTTGIETSIGDLATNRSRTAAGHPADSYAGIPLVTVEQLASAGPGAETLGETSNGARYVALRVQGDSMVPDVLEGDTIVIDLEQTQPDPGALVVAVIDNQAYVKRLRRPGGGPPRLQSADGSLLPDSPDQLYRVVQIRRDL